MSITANRTIIVHNIKKPKTITTTTTTTTNWYTDSITNLKCPPVVRKEGLNPNLGTADMLDTFFVDPAERAAPLHRLHHSMPDIFTTHAQCSHDN